MQAIQYIYTNLYERICQILLVHRNHDNSLNDQKSQTMICKLHKQGYLSLASVVIVRSKQIIASNSTRKPNWLAGQLHLLFLFQLPEQNLNFLPLQEALLECQ